MNINIYLTPNKSLSKFDFALPTIEHINFVDTRDFQTTYCDSKYNWHHFDYKGADDYFREIISKHENLPYDEIKKNIDVAEYDGFKYNITKNIDFIYKDNCGITIESNDYKDLTFYDNKYITNDYIKKAMILYCVNPLDFKHYHRQFIGSHIEYKLINKNSLTDKTLLLVTDSMSIPMIPYFITYFREIYQVDYRLNCRAKNINSFDNVICISYTEKPVSILREASYIYQCIYDVDFFNGHFYQLSNLI